MPDLTGKRVYVVDAHSLIFQVFHVMPEMTSPSGQQVGAVYGFTRDLLMLLEQKKPDCLLCAYDAAGPTFRHEFYDNYKIDREEMPDELRPQIPLTKKICQAFGSPILEVDSYEADDILATVARIVDTAGGMCYLVTGDKDCRQLITDRVFVYNIRKDEVFDAAKLQETWGIRPEQVADFQGLVGDKTDNIPGVPLIGPKTATTLLEKYDSLAGVLEHASDISGKKGKNLQAHREDALLSRRLATLDAEVPVEIDWENARAGQIDRDAALQLFHDFGFRTFGERVEAIQPAAPPSNWQTNYQIVASVDALEQLVQQMRRQSRLAIDTETTSTNPRFAEIVGYSFAWTDGEAYYVPVRGPLGDPVVPPEDALRILRPVLEDPQIEKIGQNLKYDMVVMRGADEAGGVDLAGVAFDTMVADYLLEAGARNHSLDELARRYLNHDTVKIKELIGSGRKQKRMDEVPVDTVGHYAAEDADVPLRLAPILEKRLAEERLDKLFREVEMPLIEVLVECEFNGIRVDTRRLQQMSEEFARQLERLEAEIHELAGRPFNIGSPKQLSEVLFDELKLPVIKKTKTGRSTDVEVLEELAKMRDRPGHEVAEKIVEYRQFSKLKGTYVDALPQQVHPQTGRIHTSLNQVVAATGRLSSNEPNLQNIPIRTPQGREIRSAFVPGEQGWQLLTADYSQIELRILAHYSQDEALCEAFAQDEDIHTRVASEVYGVPPGDVTGAMRRSAKAINFGIIYGQSPFGLSKALDIPKEEAAEFITAYFARYPCVARLMETILEDCLRNGCVETILGRRRKIDGVRSPEKRGANSLSKNLPERTAINTVIQGSAADLIKVAMINVHRRMKRENIRARMLLQIHDELVFEVPPVEVPLLASLVEEEMAGAFQLDVPLKVDVKTGPNWEACEALD